MSRARSALWLALHLSRREMIRKWYEWRISRVMRVVENKGNPVSVRLEAARRAYRLSRHV